MENPPRIGAAAIEFQLGAVTAKTRGQTGDIHQYALDYHADSQPNIIVDLTASPSAIRLEVGGKSVFRRRDTPVNETSAKLAETLAAARAGAPQALGEAFDACRAYLLLVAEKELDPRLKAKGGASDIVQQTFMEAQQAFNRFEGATEDEWLAWLRRLLLNNVANFRRHYETTAKRRTSRETRFAGGDSTPHAEGQLADNAPTPSREMMAEERARAVRAAMDRLPDDYQQVLNMRYHDQLPFEEIAQKLGRTANAVRKLWARAVEKLQEELDDAV